MHAGTGSGAARKRSFLAGGSLHAKSGAAAGEPSDYPGNDHPEKLLGLLTTALRSAAVRTARAVSRVGLTEDSSFFSLQRCLHARSINVRNKNNSVNVPHTSLTFFQYVQELTGFSTRV